MERDRGAINVRVIFRGRGVHPTWPERLAEEQRRTTVSVGGREIPRIRYGSEGKKWCDASEPCHDCAAVKGEFHGPRCDMERCPACRGQAISCGCASDPEV